MPYAPQISDAEWEVMKTVWEGADSPTAGEIVQRMEAAGSVWRPRTIKTLLARLVQKGAVRAEPDADSPRTFRYRAAVSREVCVRHESRSFLARVFDGDVAPALLHFVKASNLSRDDISRLKQILDDQASTKKKGRAS